MIGFPFVDIATDDAKEQIKVDPNDATLEQWGVQAVYHGEYFEIYIVSAANMMDDLRVYREHVRVLRLKYEWLEPFITAYDAYWEG